MTNKVRYINQHEQAVSKQLCDDYIKLMKKQSGKPKQRLRKCLRRKDYGALTQAMHCLAPHYNAYINFQAELYDTMSQLYFERDGNYYCSITLFIPTLVSASVEYHPSLNTDAGYPNTLPAQFVDNAELLIVEECGAHSCHIGNQLIPRSELSKVKGYERILGIGKAISEEHLEALHGNGKSSILNDELNSYFKRELVDFNPDEFASYLTPCNLLFMVGKEDFEQADVIQLTSNWNIPVAVQTQKQSRANRLNEVSEAFTEMLASSLNNAEDADFDYYVAAPQSLTLSSYTHLTCLLASKLSQSKAYIEELKELEIQFSQSSQGGYKVTVALMGKDPSGVTGGLGYSFILYPNVEHHSTLELTFVCNYLESLTNIKPTVKS